MSLVPSLLQAIVQVDGEALVMHAGDKPYIVTPGGQVDLASRGLTLEAVNGIIGQLLPPEVLGALDEFGAAQYQLPTRSEFPHEQFTIVAARGGDDLWAEIRRRRIPDEDQIPEEMFGPAATQGTMRQSAAAAGAGHLAAAPAQVPAPAPQPVEEEALSVDDLPVAAASASGEALTGAYMIGDDEALDLPEPAVLFATRRGTSDDTPAVPTRGDAGVVELPPVAGGAPDAPSTRQDRTEPAARMDAAIPAGALDRSRDAGIEATAEAAAGAPMSTGEALPTIARGPDSSGAPPLARAPMSPAPASGPRHGGVTQAAPSAPRETAKPQASPARAVAESAAPPPAEPRQAAPLHAPEAARPVPPAVRDGSPPSPAGPQAVAAPQPAVVLPLSRSPIRPEPPAEVTGQSGIGLDRLLRLAAARGASTLYLVTGLRPSLRVDGEHRALEGEPPLSAYDVESLVLAIMPERSHEALRTGAPTEWVCDLEEVGRIRCMSYRDHRGPGGVFRLMPVRAVSTDQLALPREIQALAIEPEGLVLVAGPRSSGKRTLIAALIDLINRSRRDHVISIESEINVMHDRGTSLVSQREVRGGSDEVLAAARAALREDPDVLAIEDLRNGALVNVALEAAAAGRLVIGGFSARSAPGAIDRIIDLYAPEYRRQLQMAIAEHLRGVVAQVLLRKQGGGRVAARELLLNTPAVASLIADGKTSQLPMAIEGGRKHGMVPLNDALVGFVQNGTVDLRDAYRRSPDRGAFLALLKRQGIDTSPLERLA
ncbi:MAG: Flp pilus assembly complex ATPase component TadA [Acidobacteria bacterium]|nr:Flp pilus assembly complex ATPase component TadA [Acidobacteriota bacterium]